MKVQADAGSVRVETATGAVVVVTEDAGRAVVEVDGVWVWRENRPAQAWTPDRDKTGADIA